MKAVILGCGPSSVHWDGNSCNNCNHLKYNHDYGIQVLEWECKKSNKVKLNGSHENIPTPSDCPLNKYCDFSIGVNDANRHKPSDYLLIVNNLSKWPDRQEVVMKARPKILWSHVSTYAHHPSYQFLGSWQRWKPSNQSVTRGTQYSSNNSTFMAASRAFNMGATEIVLYGVDFENHQDINGKTLERAVNDWVTFNECLKKQHAFIKLGVEYGALKGLL